MRRFICVLLSLIILSFCLNQAILGVETSKSVIAPTKINVDFSPVSVKYNDKLLSFKAVKYNNVEYVSLKDFCYFFKISAVSNSKDKTVDLQVGKIPTGKYIYSGSALSKGIVKIDSLVNQYKITVNSIDSYLDSFTYKDAIFVPLQYIAEIANKKLVKDDKAPLITISDITDSAIGSVNGEKIMKSEFDVIYNLQKQANATEDSIKTLKTKVFDILVNRKIIMQKFSETKTIVTPEDYTKLNAALAQLIANYGDSASFRKILSEKGVTLYQYTLAYKTDYIINYIFIPQVVKQVAASESEVKQYYEYNKTDYINPETVRAKHILIRTTDASGAALTQEKKDEAKKKAEDILKQLKAGADFDTLMNQYSEDTGLKSYPKGYTFPKGQMVKEFEDAAFTLKIGEVSEIVETVYGYHIIKVEEKTPQKQLTYEEAKTGIKDLLDNNEKQKFYTNIMNYWKSYSKVENKMK